MSCLTVNAVVYGNYLWKNISYSRKKTQQWVFLWKHNQPLRFNQFPTKFFSMSNIVTPFFCKFCIAIQVSITCFYFRMGCDILQHFETCNCVVSKIFEQNSLKSSWFGSILLLAGSVKIILFLMLFVWIVCLLFVWVE